MLLLTKYTVLYKENEICCIILLSLPSRERGLKFCDGRFPRVPLWSLPSRERGLKYLPVGINIRHLSSLPSRERGLKCQDSIEDNDYQRRSLRGSVD